MKNNQEFKEFRSLQPLKENMLKNGVKKLFVKYLSPNDNSKNQVYLGGSFDVLNVFPFDEIITVTDRKLSKRDRYKASLKFYWIDGNNRKEIAPHAQLILYPKYPEVRFSGFLQNCRHAPSEKMKTRENKRLLFLGITNDGEIIGHVCGAQNPIRNEIDSIKQEKEGVFKEILFTVSNQSINAKQDLIQNLKRINSLGWITSARLNSSGVKIPCRSSNCGGYTLEYLFGITPNGYAEPDYMGWELKQHSVRDLNKPSSGGAITLMTPEPTGGFYKTQGVEDFIRTYGYKDRNGRIDRLNFGGIYRVNKKTEITGLKTILNGYSLNSNKLDNINGGLLFLDQHDNIAAEWSFSALLKIWNRKHAKAVFIPSKRRMNPEQQYHYGHLVELGEGTDFFKFLNAMIKGAVYLDPALKMENISSNKPKIKRRNQFRINPNKLNNLYHTFSTVNLNE